MQKKTRKTVRVLQGAIRFYAYLVSPFLGKNCRYHPTCSSYMNDALETHGILKGLYLGIRRIFACHPWSKRPFSDPVPKRFAWRDILGYKRSGIKNKTQE